MATNENRGRRSFKQLEREMTIVILANLVLFLVTMASAAFGIGWLKFIVGILTILIGGLGCVFLVLIDEYKRRRSWWMIAAFGSMAVVTLVSLIVGYPAPPVA